MRMLLTVPASELAQYLYFDETVDPVALVAALRTKRKQSLPIQAGAGFSTLPLLALAACGGGSGVAASPPPAPPPPAPTVVAPTLTAVAPTPIIAGAQAASGNVLPTANQSGKDVATITDVSIAGGPIGTVGGTVTSSLGNLVLKSDGSYSFTVADNASVHALAAGETQTITVNFTAHNSAGSASSTLALTVTGVNDPPVAHNDSVIAPAVVTAPITGNVLANDTDVDHGSVLMVTGVTAAAAQISAAVGTATSFTSTGTFGTVTVNADGSYSYVLDQTNTAFLALREGQTAVENFTYSESDGAGGTASGTLGITVTGINHGPQIADRTFVIDLSKATSATDYGPPYGDGAYSIIPPLKDAEGDSKFSIVAVDGKPFTVTAQTSGGITYQSYSAFSKDYGSIIIGAYNATDNYLPLATDQSSFIKFSILDQRAKVLALAEGQSVDQTVALTVADERGGTSVTHVTFHIIGGNEPPLVQDLRPITLSTNSLTYTADLHTIAPDPEGDPATYLSIEGITNYVNVPIKTKLGTVVVDAAGHLTYTVDTTSPLYISASPTGPQFDSISITATDGKHTGTSSITFKIFGVNDPPVAVPGGAGSQVFSDQLPQIASFLGGVTDPDYSDLSPAIGGVNLLKIVSIGHHNVVSGFSATSAHGLFTITSDANNPFSDSLAANFHVVFDQTNPAIANLAYGSTISDTIDYTVVDPSGASANSTLTYTITGAKQVGTPLDDIIHLSRTAETINGGLGNDHFFFWDHAILGRPADYFHNFNGGNSVINGGPGTDTIDFSDYDLSPAVPVIIDLRNSTPISIYDTTSSTFVHQNTQVTGVENIYGSKAADLINGDDNANVIFGGFINTDVRGSGFDDEIHGNGGDDVLIGGVTNAAVGGTCYGGGGNDIIVSFNEFGDAGNDILVSLGYANLHGGTGADTFVIVNGPHGDGNLTHIFDFSQTDGDKIDLSAFRDANGNVLHLSDIISNSTINNGHLDINLGNFLLAGTSGSHALLNIQLDGISNLTTLTASDFIFIGGPDWHSHIPSDIPI